MRHVGRFDPETKLPITEVTQAEFDELPLYEWTLPTGTFPGKWFRRGEKVGAYFYERPDLPPSEIAIAYRRLVIVEDSSPRVPYPTTRSTNVSSGSGSLALVSDA